MSEDNDVYNITNCYTISTSIHMLMNQNEKKEIVQRERTIDLCCFGWKMYFFKIFVRDLSIRLRENFTIYSWSVFDALSNDVIFINLAWDQNFRTSLYVNEKGQRAQPCTDRKITIFSIFKAKVVIHSSNF